MKGLYIYILVFSLPVFSSFYSKTNVEPKPKTYYWYNLHYGIKTYQFDGVKVLEALPDTVIHSGSIRQFSKALRKGKKSLITPLGLYSDSAEAKQSAILFYNQVLKDESYNNLSDSIQYFWFNVLITDERKPNLEYLYRIFHYNVYSDNDNSIQRFIPHSFFLPSFLKIGPFRSEDDAEKSKEIFIKYSKK